MIVEVNVFGVTELLTAWRPALAAGAKAKVVVFGSNSTTSTPFVPKSAVRKLMKGDAAAAATIIRRRGKVLSGPVAYAASKLAVTQWCRVHGTDLDWAGAGIRLNVIAPGPIGGTDMFHAVIPKGSDREAALGKAIPVQRLGRPDDVARTVMFFCDRANSFITGQTLYVCGGASLGSITI